MCEEYDTIDVVFRDYPSVTPPAPSRDSDDENVMEIFGFKKNSKGNTCVLAKSMMTNMVLSL